MTELLLKVLRNTKSRIWFTLATLLIFVAGCVLFGINEIKSNREVTLEIFEEKQQELTDQISDYVQDNLIQGISVQDIQQNMNGNSVNSSFRWCFFGRDNVLLQAKDNNNLARLKKTKITRVSELVSWLEQKQQIVTTVTFEQEGHSYCIGVMSDYDNVILTTQLSKHNVYMMLLIGLLCLVFSAVTILCVIYTSQRDKKIEQLSKELVETSQKLEELYEDSLLENKAAEEAAATVVSDRIYEDDIIFALLKKTNSEELFPFGMLYIKLNMSSRYYSKDEIYQLMLPIKDKLLPNHILTEVAKGEFAILLYRTSLEASIKYKKRIEKYLKGVLPKHDITGTIELETMEQLNVEVSLGDKFKQLRALANKET